MTTTTFLLYAALVFLVLILAIGALTCRYIERYSTEWGDLREMQDDNSKSPLLREALKRDQAFNASTHLCANNMGRSYNRPAFIPAPGYFWKRDIAGNRKWRLYRQPVR